MADSSGNHWATKSEYGDSGYNDADLVLQAAPSAVNVGTGTLTFGSYTLNTSSGLLYEYDYYASTGSGGATGCLHSEEVLNGSDQFQTSNATLLDSYTYCVHSGTSDGLSVTIYPVASHTVYRNDDGTGTATTGYAYSWYPGTLQVKEIDTTLPAVTDGSGGSTDQNGSGTSAASEQWFDDQGSLIWSMDERGYLTHYVYDPVTGLLTETVEDVSTASLSLPTGCTWTPTPNSTGQNLTTDYQYDSLGRVTQILGPEHNADVGGTSADLRTATWYVYLDATHEVFRPPAMPPKARPTRAIGTPSRSINPVSITKYDARRPRHRRHFGRPRSDFRQAHRRRRNRP